jgi:hypothetical protein
MSELTPRKLKHLLTFCLGKELPRNHKLRREIENTARQFNYQPLGSYYLRGVDMEGVIGLTQNKNISKDGLNHYFFVWYSKQGVSLTSEPVIAELMIESLMPPRFSLRGKPNTFVKILGESSMIQSILVDLIDDLKCLEYYSIINAHANQQGLPFQIQQELIGDRFIVLTKVSDSATNPLPGKVERMEMALPQLIDLANYSIMSGLKMYGPTTEFSNFCPFCGKKLPHGDNAFCIHCGEKL